MRLSWKDAVSTLLVAACGLIFLAVTDAWGWPLLSSYHTGAAALLAVGLAACIVGGSDMVSLSDDPLTLGASTLGFFAFAVAIFGSVTGSETAFAILAVTIAMLWVVATIHHALEDERHHQQHPVAHA